MKTKPKKLKEQLNIIRTIAAKDILDGLQNKVVLSLVLGVLFMLLMPSLMTWMLEPPYATVLVYDPGSSQLISELDEDKAFRVQRLPTFETFETAVADLGLGIGVEYGLLVPADFDQRQAESEIATVEVYAPWSFRFKIPKLSLQIEQQLSTLSGAPVRVNYDGNLVYPPPQSTLYLGLSTWLPVIIILMVGLNMMPQLFFEEKQTRTIDALLVSPVTEGQLVAGKALVGMFYILVTALVAFGLNWNRVVHWELALLFVVCGGLFGVGIGLVLGTFFDRYQEIFGWSMLILLLLIAAIFVQIIDLDLPEVVRQLLPWVPSAAMAEIITASYIKEFSWRSVLTNAGSVLGFSAVLCTLVIWRLRRSDR
jgi:ABC-2 type transport system permease protein